LLLNTSCFSHFDIPLKMQSLRPAVAKQMLIRSRSFGGLSSLQREKIRDLLARRGSKKNGVEQKQLVQVSTGFELPYIISPYSTKINGSRKEVLYEDLVELINSGNLQLIDVREPHEVQAGQIPTAINIPLLKLKYSLQLPEELYMAQYGAGRLPMGNDMIFYGLCSVKGITALEIAFKLGLKKARHYPGGYQEWCARQGSN